MSEFLERNKKKGWLALLLLLLGRGKGIGPLIAMLCILSALFVAPAGMLSNVPWLSRALSHVGLGGLLGQKEYSFDGLDDALRSARNARNIGMTTSASRSGGGGSEYYGKSTVGLVQGGKELVDGRMAGKDGLGESVAKNGGRSVSGVLTPDDAKKRADGVSVDEDEMRNGLLKNAFAGMTGGAEGLNPAALAGLDSSALAGGASTLAGRNGLSGKNGLGSGRADSGNLAKNALASARVPVVGGGLAVKGAAGDKVAWSRLKGLKTSLRGVNTAVPVNKGTVMYQLAEGRAYSIAAAPPPGYCNPGPCPNEYASNTSGAVFDGKKPGGNIMTAEEAGDPGVPVTPDDGQIASLIDEADQMEEDAKKCEAAERDYGPQERQVMKQIQATSDRINSTCQGGGCKSNAGTCRALANQIRSQCGQYNSIAQKKANACPLMNGQYTQMNCNQ
ncbi:MAG: hypothetical protein WC969_06835 [Elusimicrobiota bacterium]|jgi:hypothetical protein